MTVETIDTDPGQKPDDAPEVDEFDQAWEEEEQAGQPEPEQNTDGDASEGETPEQGDAAQIPEGGGDGAQAPAQGDDPGQGDEDIDYRALWEKDHQRMKSWEGRLSKEVAERRALEEELERLKAQQNQQQGADPGESQDTGEGAAGEGGGVVTDAFREEYGDEIADFVEQRARELAKAEAEQLIDQRLAPLEQARQEIEVQAHYAKIAAEHPDFQEVAASDEFAQWMNSLPGTFKQAAEQVVAAGTPEEVIDLLNSYKQATNAEQRTTQQRATRARRSAAVHSRPSGPPRKQPPKDDFDASWDSF